MCRRHQSWKSGDKAPVEKPGKGVENLRLKFGNKEVVTGGTWNAGI